MARIRSIKPGFCTSESIADLTIPCRLHFAMLWTYADDAGRGVDNARLIKAALWPLDDDVEVGQIEAWQQELAGHGRMVRYESEGRRYFEITNFAEHQRPNRPVPSAIPGPVVGEQCSLTAEALCEPVSLIPVVVVGEVEVEGDGEERTSLALVSPTPDELFELFWDSYPRKVNKPGSKRAFAKALKAASVAEIGSGLKAWKLAWTDPDFIPHPTTWLNQHRWDDPPPAPKQRTAPAAADTIIKWASQ